MVAQPPIDRDGRPNSSLPITKDGIWMDLRMVPLKNPRPALFLDRDGIIIRDCGFISDPEKIDIIQDTVDLIRFANQAAIPVVVVTNQSGIDRNLFGWHSFYRVETEISEKLRALGVKLDATAACPFHPDYTFNFSDDHAWWRKPEPGLIIEISKHLGIALSRSWIIGDRWRDIEAGRRANLSGGIMISPGKTECTNKEMKKMSTLNFNNAVCQSAEEAIHHLIAVKFF